MTVQSTSMTELTCFPSWARLDVLAVKDGLASLALLYEGGREGALVAGVRELQVGVQPGRRCRRGAAAEECVQQGCAWRAELWASGLHSHHCAGST